MVKHPACAAAISSSGFVPFSFSKRVLNEYGVLASTPESVERSPLPSRPVPRQTAFALRIMETSSFVNTKQCYAPMLRAPVVCGNFGLYGAPYWLRVHLSSKAAACLSRGRLLLKM